MKISDCIDNLVMARFIFRRHGVGRVSMSRKAYARKIVELLRENGIMTRKELCDFFGTNQLGVLPHLVEYGVLIQLNTPTPRKIVTGTVRKFRGISYKTAPNAEDKLQEAMAHPWF